MEDNDWMDRLNRRPIMWWLHLCMHHERRGGMVSTDPSLVEYNYTRSFHPVHLNQWIRVFQLDPAIDMFHPEAVYVCKRYIWHHDVLHRIVTHRDPNPWFYHPIGDELPQHFIFQALQNYENGGEFFNLHLYGRRRDLNYVWNAIYVLLRLDYHPGQFESIGLAPYRAHSIGAVPEPWDSDTARMRSWLSTRQGPQHRFQLTLFAFDLGATLELLRGAIRGCVFNFTRCVFSDISLFQDGRLVFGQGFLAVVLATLRDQPALIYVILRTNVNVIIQ